MSGHAPTSRPREKPMGDEAAEAELQLGEFQNVPTLTLSEANAVINAVVVHRQTNGGKMAETEVLVKTQDYLEVFARFKQKETITAVERLLEEHEELELFERSQIGSLCCETAEEAKTLIPSIANKISDLDLQTLLEDIMRLQNFVE